MWRVHESHGSGDLMGCLCFMNSAIPRAAATPQQLLPPSGLAATPWTACLGDTCGLCGEPSGPAPAERPLDSGDPLGSSSATPALRLCPPPFAPPSHCQDGGRGGMSMHAIREKVDRCAVELDKAVKMTTKVFDRGQAIDPCDRSPSLESLLTACEASLQTVELLCSDLSFMAKFRKTKAGEPLTEFLAKETVTSGSKALRLGTHSNAPPHTHPPSPARAPSRKAVRELIDAAKALRSVLPKA